MAEKFTNQRCEDCQGGLEYNKTEKYWECPYCGKKYERALRFDKVQIDGLAGINDLVRSTLLKIITLDFEGAQRDLSECEKINHASVGTLIAHMAFALFRSLYNPKDRQQELTKVNNYMQRLRRDFAEVDDPEEILYDFIDSSDIYALLVVLYSSVGESTRLQMIYNLLDCNEVYNPNVSKFLLNALLKGGKVEEADTLLNNMSAENARFGVMAVLTNYPSTLKKAEHLERLLSMGKRDADYSAIFNSYFEKTADSSDVVLEVFLTASARNVNFDASVVIRSIFEHCDSVETAERIFAALSAKRLDEASAMAVLDWAAFGTDNPEISQIAFTSLFESNSVFELDDEIVIKLLASEQSDELRAAKLGQMMRTFKMSAKNIDRVVAYYMLQSEDSGELRREMFADLLGYVTSVQLTVIEKYLLTVTTDGEMKADILDMALAKSKSVALCNALFSQYLKLAVDAPEVREAVIGKLLDYRLTDGGVCALTSRGEIMAGTVVLALGHSARDSFEMLFSHPLTLAPKPFSVGVRIEHLREDIDRALYGAQAGHPALGPAEYALSDTKGERGVYTFCMCPGGEVVTAASEEGGVVTNGMSYHARAGVNSNAAVLVSVTPADVGGKITDAIAFQRGLEQAAFRAGGGNYQAPVETVGDFLGGFAATAPTRVRPTYGGGRVRVTDLTAVLPPFVVGTLQRGLASFEKKITGFAAPDAVLTAVESRTSAPLRILRSEARTAIGEDLIYPAGEGAGYAGGITSAALDGLHAALAIIARFSPCK